MVVMGLESRHPCRPVRRATMRPDVLIAKKVKISHSMELIFNCSYIAGLLEPGLIYLADKP